MSPVLARNTWNLKWKKRNIYMSIQKKNEILEYTFKYVQKVYGENY